MLQVQGHLLPDQHWNYRDSDEYLHRCAGSKFRALPRPSAAALRTRQGQDASGTTPTPLGPVVEVLLRKDQKKNAGRCKKLEGSLSTLQLLEVCALPQLVASIHFGWGAGHLPISLE